MRGVARVFLTGEKMYAILPLKIPKTFKEETMEFSKLQGVWAVEKMFGVVGGKPALYTRAETEPDLDQKFAAGEIDEHEKKESLSLFEAEFEFCPDGTIKTWLPLPVDITEEEVREAVKAGEILAAKDGKMVIEEKKWIQKDDGIYVNTGEVREVFGEALSPEDELKTDEEGLLIYGDGMMRLKKQS